MQKESCLKTLVTKYSPTHYDNLIETTAVDLLLNNLKRPGETKRAHLSDWEYAKRTNEDKAEYRQLEKDNQEQIRIYIRMDIRGKKQDGKGSSTSHYYSVIFFYKSRHFYSENPFKIEIIINLISGMFEFNYQK